MKHLKNKLSAFLLMLMCVSATMQAEIVHHTVCDPKPNSRGFTVECWEDSETGKFYTDAGCTEELVGLALAKAVTYAKLPENPVTRTNKFSVKDEEHLNIGDGGIAEPLDLNWSASTYINFLDFDFNHKVTRYAEFTVKEKWGSNVRMVWYRNNPQSGYGRYYVEISVNGKVVYTKDNDKDYQGVFVVSLPDLKRNDVVRFAVKQTAISNWSGGPTFKASLEYNFPCSQHEYHAGSAICSQCGYVKEHEHTYGETETCSLCGAPNPSNEISTDVWTIADGSDQLVVDEDITIKKMYYTRNFPKANQWQALYVPFEMKYSDWKEKFDVAAISNFHEYIDEYGEIEKVELEVRYVKTGKLIPNIPYLIRAKEAGEQTIILNNAALKATEERSISCSSTERKYTFTGTYDAIDRLQSKDYIYVSDDRLCKADDDTDVLKAMRWYITIADRESMTYTPSAPLPLAKSMSIRLVGEDETTGIMQIENGELKIDNSQPTRIFNLNGMRLSKPQKGINIINGKKVFVK
ncbi:MAG: hypothetical protein KBT39_04835 [Bacteroidales bacterium]|nr:hypothetical protein [Bacteroidales bacterium]